MFGGATANRQPYRAAIVGKIQQDSNPSNEYLNVEGSAVTNDIPHRDIQDMSQFDSTDPIHNVEVTKNVQPPMPARQSIVMSGTKNNHAPGSKEFDADIVRFNEHIA